jgi:hypothetical protein
MRRVRKRFPLPSPSNALERSFSLQLIRGGVPAAPLRGRTSAVTLGWDHNAVALRDERKRAKH